MRSKNLFTVFVFIGSLISLTAFAQDSSGVSCTFEQRLHVGYVFDVAIRGNLAYLATNGELVVVNVSNPAATSEVSHLAANIGYDSKIALSGNYALITGYQYNDDQDYQGIYTFNITDPAHPSSLGFMTLSGMPSDIIVRDSLMAVVIPGDSIFIFNIANHAQPSLVTTHAVPGLCNLTLSDSLAFVTNIVNDTLRLNIYSFANILAPRWLGACILHHGEYTGRNKPLISGNYAYIPNDSTLVDAVNIANPAAPVLTGSNGNLNSSLGNIVKYGNTLYWFGNTNAIHLIDISTPQTPQYIESYYGNSLRTVGSPYNVVFQNDTMYIVDLAQGLWINRVTLPRQISTLGGFYLDGFAEDIAVSGNYCYLADGNSGLRVYNIAGATPVQISRVPTHTYAQKVKISGNYAYLMGWDSIRVFNISNPAQPRQIAEFGNHIIFDFDIRGNYAYTIEYVSDDSLKAYDISDPASPVSAWGADFDQPDRNYTKIQISDSIAIFSSNSCIELQNMGRIGFPDLIVMDSLDYFSDLAFQGNYLYVAFSDSLRIYRFAIPDLVIQVSAYANGDIAFFNSILVSGNYLFGYGSGGLRVLNIADPLHLREIGYDENAFYTNKMVYGGNRIFTVGQTLFAVYDVAQALGIVDRVSTALPQSITLKPNYPNPFNATTTIEYTLPATTHVDLKVFDLQGREIGTLVNFSQHPGTYRVHFDGKTLASGTYFLRLQAGSVTKTQKLILLR